MKLLHDERKTVKVGRAKCLRQNENPIKRGVSRLRTNDNSPRYCQEDYLRGISCGPRINKRID